MVVCNCEDWAGGLECGEDADETEADVVAECACTLLPGVRTCFAFSRKRRWANLFCALRRSSNCCGVSPAVTPDRILTDEALRAMREGQTYDRPESSSGEGKEAQRPVAIYGTFTH